MATTGLADLTDQARFAMRIFEAVLVGAAFCDTGPRTERTGTVRAALATSDRISGQGSARTIFFDVTTGGAETRNTASDAGNVISATASCLHVHCDEAHEKNRDGYPDHTGKNLAHTPSLSISERVMRVVVGKCAMRTAGDLMQMPDLTGVPVKTSPLNIQQRTAQCP
jgi:hypothetical protein